MHDLLQDTEPRYESKLPPELQEFVRTTEFKDWFGDWEGDPENASRIVDGNGEPLVVYSGLPAGIRELKGDRRYNTTTGEVGFYFTKRFNNARGMAEQREDWETGEPLPASIYGAFLNIRKPRVVQRGEHFDTTKITPDRIPAGVDGFINDKLQEIVVIEPDQALLLSESPIHRQ